MTAQHPCLKLPKTPLKINPKCLTVSNKVCERNVVLVIDLSTGNNYFHLLKNPETVLQERSRMTRQDRKRGQRK